MARELRQPKYKCNCCGKEYNQLKTHFYVSASSANKDTGYLSTCKTCVQKIYTELEKKYDSEYKAVRRVCMMFDIYFSEKVFQASAKRNADTNRMCAYMGMYNRAQYGTVGKTYEDSIDEEKAQELLEASKHLYDTPIEKDEVGQYDISHLKKKFGLGYEDDEYLAMEDHYNILSAKIDDNDVVQQLLIMDLCDTKIQEIRCRKKGDTKGMREFKQLYQTTLGTANLKPKESNYNDENDSLINSIALIEKYAPPQVVGHLELFKDIDNLEPDYLSRFIERPHRNLENDTNIMDEEYSI